MTPLPTLASPELSNRKRKKLARRTAMIDRFTSPTNHANGLTVAKIIQITKSKGYFSVNRYRHRDRVLRMVLASMKITGLLVGGRHDGSGSLIYYLAAPALSVRQTSTQERLI
jgi:hypothetical protein